MNTSRNIYKLNLQIILLNNNTNIIRYKQNKHKTHSKKPPQSKNIICLIEVKCFCNRKMLLLICWAELAKQKN